ncbi:hypothetical protein NL676_020270 [Syzygium grande]|nr:hypothetical protein NL676_020270 [Syzygium grande]
MSATGFDMLMPFRGQYDNSDLTPRNDLLLFEIQHKFAGGPEPNEASEAEPGSLDSHLPPPSGSLGSALRDSVFFFAPRAPLSI